MSDEDPIDEFLAPVVEARRAKIEEHKALRSSPGYVTAQRRTNKLVADFGLGLNAVSTMSTRHASFGEQRLSIRMHDILLESAIATMSNLREGLLSPARREMRFLLEASVKAWWCDATEPRGDVVDKVEFLDDLGAFRFREVVDTLNPKLIATEVSKTLIAELTDLYGSLSTQTHPSSASVGLDLARGQKGVHKGFETVSDINKANDLFTRVLDVSVAAILDSFEPGLVGDIFVVVFDENPRWAFHKTKYVASISAHFDYKHERQNRSRRPV